MAQADFSHYHRKLIRLLKGVLNLAFLDPKVARVESVAHNHKTKSCWATIITEETSTLLARLKAKHHDPEFEEFRQLLKDMMMRHAEFKERAPQLLSSIRRTAPDFDWDLVIESEPISAEQRKTRTLQSPEDMTANDRRFLKSLRISSEEPTESVIKNNRQA